MNGLANPAPYGIVFVFGFAVILAWCRLDWKAMLVSVFVEVCMWPQENICIWNTWMDTERKRVKSCNDQWKANGMIPIWWIILNDLRKLNEMELYRSNPRFRTRWIKKNCFGHFHDVSAWIAWRVVLVMLAIKDFIVLDLWIYCVRKSE